MNEQGCGITPTSSENEFRAVALSACILAEICVILRMWVKIFVVKQVSLDDWFIILAGVSFLQPQTKTPTYQLARIGHDYTLSLPSYDKSVQSYILLKNFSYTDTT